MQCDLITINFFDFKFHIKTFNFILFFLILPLVVERLGNFKLYNTLIRNKREKLTYLLT